MYNRLKILRVCANMKQSEVAQKLNIHQTTYSKYELGTTDIPTTTLKQLAKMYNTSTDFILELTDEIHPYPQKRKIK